MAPKPSIKIVKSFSYRGATQLWSNRYHMDGHTGLTTGEWTALADQIAGEERHLFASNVTVVEAVGYEAGSDVPVFTKAYSLAGDFVTDATDVSVPGDVAALVRYSTTQRTSKNHPIYLFNYYHGLFHSSGDRDSLPANVKTNLESYAQAWVTGAWTDGTHNYTRCGPNGAVAQSRIVESLLTHRDFPR